MLNFRIFQQIKARFFVANHGMRFFVVIFAALWYSGAVKKTAKTKEKRT
jgi:hypothetical protein